MLKRFLLVALSVNVVTSTFSQDSSINNFSIFGNLVSEDTLTIENLYNFQIAGPYLIIRIGERHDSSSTIELRDLENFDVLWAEKCPCTGYRFNDEDPVNLVISQSGYEGLIKVSAYDLNSGLLFSRRHPTSMFIPGFKSKYFVSVYDPFMEPEHSFVLDRNGKPIRLSGFIGNAFALNDSIIASVNQDSIHLNSVLNGQLIKRLYVPSHRKLVGSVHTLYATSRKFTAITMDYILMIINSDYEIAWVDSSRSDQIGLSISPDSKWLVIYHRMKRTAFVSFLETATGKEIWTKEIDFNRLPGLATKPSVTVTRNLVTILDPQMDFVYQGKLRENQQTIVHEYDQDTGELTKQSQIPGITMLRDEGDVLYSCTVTADNRNQIIVRKWQVEN